MAGLAGTKGRGDWTTPRLFFAEVNERFRFTLDAASSDENRLCNRWYTEADNALVQPWTGRVWCNPPYGDIMPWVQKAIAEHRNGNARVVVMPVPSSTGTRWFHAAVDSGASVEFLKGRLKFGDGKKVAPFASLLLVWKF